MGNIHSNPFTGTESLNAEPGERLNPNAGPGERLNPNLYIFLDRPDGFDIENRQPDDIIK